MCLILHTLKLSSELRKIYIRNYINPEEIKYDR